MFKLHAARSSRRQGPTCPAGFGGGHPSGQPKAVTDGPGLLGGQSWQRRGAERETALTSSVSPQEQIAQGFSNSLLGHALTQV